MEFINNYNDCSNSADEEENQEMLEDQKKDQTE